YSKPALDLAGNDAIESLGAPFAQYLSGVSTPMSSVIDPTTIAQQVFHQRFDLEDRASAIAALQAAFPVTTNENGKSVVKSSPAQARISSAKNGWRLYGRL